MSLQARRQRETWFGQHRRHELAVARRSKQGGQTNTKTAEDRRLPRIQQEKRGSQ